MFLLRQAIAPNRSPWFRYRPEATIFPSCCYRSSDAGNRGWHHKNDLGPLDCIASIGLGVEVCYREVDLCIDKLRKVEPDYGFPV